MNKENSWRELPATKKQIKFLSEMAIDSFSNLSRGQASKMIKNWLEMNQEDEIDIYDQDTLEDYK